MTNILLVNPPIFDFSAYDFWLRPYGMLQAAGEFRGRCDMTLFDFLDRSAAPRGGDGLRRDQWGRGEFPSQVIDKPPALADVPRRFRRFGRPREEFIDFLRARRPFDAVLIQTMMTYWYGGLVEVIGDIRRHGRGARIVLGGVYATLCPAHAAALGADLVLDGGDLSPLEALLGLAADSSQPALWEVCPAPPAGVIKLSDGCPMRCTYCCVSRLCPTPAPRPPARAAAEFDLLARLGARNIAFYDDALLHQADRTLLPLLEHARRGGCDVNFHTPNALHARWLTKHLAAAMVGGGFRTFYLGFESSSADWQRQTGGKVTGDDLAAAVDCLRQAGASGENITAYVLLGHPRQDAEHVEASMRFAHGLGIAVSLAEFSPIPGTIDGEACRTVADMDEPLNHNKTAFAIRALGPARVDRLKDLCRRLNGRP